MVPNGVLMTRDHELSSLVLPPHSASADKRTPGPHGGSEGARPAVQPFKVAQILLTRSHRLCWSAVGNLDVWCRRAVICEVFAKARRTPSLHHRRRMGLFDVFTSPRDGSRQRR